MGQWDTYAICPGCDAKHRAPFGDTFHIHFECCPSCGTPKRGWRVRIMRWVSTSELFRPSTWGTGRWETREDPSHG